MELREGQEKRRVRDSASRLAAYSGRKTLFVSATGISSNFRIFRARTGQIAQAEQKMPRGRVRCELSEGFRAVRVSFGKAARFLCRDPKCPEVFKRQLEEAKTEWRRRHPKLSDMCARRKPEEGGFPGRGV